MQDLLSGGHTAARPDPMLIALTVSPPTENKKGGSARQTGLSTFYKSKLPDSIWLQYQHVSH